MEGMFGNKEGYPLRLKYTLSTDRNCELMAITLDVFVFLVECKL